MTNIQIDADLVFQKSRTFGYEDAEKVSVCYKRALKIKNKDSTIYSRWAELQLKEDRFPESNRVFRLAVTFALSQSDVYLSWIHNLYALRRFQDILLISEKAIDKVKNPALVKNICGMCFIHIGSYEKAIKLFEEAYQLDPNLKMNHLNQALAFYLNGEYGKATQKLEEIKDLLILVPRFKHEILLLEQDLRKEQSDEIKEQKKFKIKGF